MVVTTPCTGETDARDSVWICYKLEAAPAELLREIAAGGDGAEAAYEERETRRAQSPWANETLARLGLTMDPRVESRKAQKRAHDGGVPESSEGSSSEDSDESHDSDEELSPEALKTFMVAIDAILGVAISWGSNNKAIAAVHGLQPGTNKGVLRTFTYMDWFKREKCGPPAGSSGKLHSWVEKSSYKHTEGIMSMFDAAMTIIMDSNHRE
jgi:hypothetical protein